MNREGFEVEIKVHGGLVIHEQKERWGKKLMGVQGI
jgi:hypothetical protein